MKYFQANIFFISLLLILIIVINLFFLQDFWGFGVIWEDWQFLLNFITDYNTGSIITKVVKFWLFSPVHWGIQTAYAGIFDQLFPGNYFILQVFNVMAKITATILLYPLILSLTKNKLLAILTPLIYSVHYSSYGSLQQYTNGVEYWAIVFIILFILNYRKIILKGDYRLLRLFTSLSLLYLGLAFGLYRLTGVIILLLAVEIFLYFTKRSSFKTSLLRVSFFILIPVLLVFSIHRPTGTTGNFLSNTLNHILQGNLLIFINPLAGLALTFIPRPFVGTFEDLELLKSFTNYFSYFINTFALPFGAIILMSGYILPVKFIRFLITAIVGNLIFSYLLFFFASSFVGTPRLDIIPMATIGIFILSLSLSFGLEFLLSGRKNILLAILFATPFVSLLFTTLTWIFKIDPAGSIAYQDGMHRYLTVPAIGTSIFIASFLTLTLQEVTKNRVKKIINLSLVLILGTFLIYASLKELKIYKIERDTGRELSLQRSVQTSFYNDYVKDKGDLVIYYIPSSPQSSDDVKLERALYPQIINWWSYLRHYYSNGYNTKGLGCIMVLAYPWHQKDATIRQVDGQIKFVYPAICPVEQLKLPKKILYAENRQATLQLNNLFAFTIREGKIKNITEETKRRIIEDPSLSTLETDAKKLNPDVSNPPDKIP